MIATIRSPSIAPGPTRLIDTEDAAIEWTLGEWRRVERVG